MGSNAAEDTLHFDPGSYRDRRGRVFEYNGRVLRTLSPDAERDFAWIEGRGLLAHLIEQGRVVRTWRADNSGPLETDGSALIEHERLPFVSYPYEWSFSALKAAALHHLNLHREALLGGATLTDASAYNVQFIGPNPVFIDLPSLRPYRDGEYWFGHQQFLDQFLNPLVLTAFLGVDQQRIFRGSLDGIPTAMLKRLLALRDRLRPGIFMHVVLPGLLQQLGNKRGFDPSKAMNTRSLSKTAYAGMLDGLSLIIKGLKRQSARSSVWSDYTTTSSYSAQEFELKRSFVERYVGATRPKMLLDIGCNTGSYSEIALKSGAGYIVGIEQDPAAADLAFQRAVDNKLNFLPLVLDLADPSPAQGWASQERRSFSNRCSFDGMIALAVEHHLAIGRNIPLDMLIDHMVGLAPTGVIEFVPKSDPQTQRLLSLREDIFPDHTREVFGSLLAAKARIVDEQSITGSGRVLYWYDRSAP